MIGFDGIKAQPARFTLSDILASSRYWALLGSMVLVHLGFIRFSTTLPLTVGLSEGYDRVGIYHIGVYLGMLPGAAFAFTIIGRCNGAGLGWLTGFGAISTSLYFLLPETASSDFWMLPIGFSQGALQAALPVALAVLLFGGRSEPHEFAAAFALMTATYMLGQFGSIGTILIANVDEAPSSPAWLLLACLAVATALIGMAGPMRFDTPPKRRPRPLAPRHRAPLLVAITLGMPAIVFLIAVTITLMQPASASLDPIPGTVSLMAGLIAAICLAYWLYRIHGELADAETSQRLLSPVMACVIGTLVPLGLPIVLMMLSDMLRERATARGEDPFPATGWVVLWAILLPPVAAAVIQNAANLSHASSEETATAIVP